MLRFAKPSEISKARDRLIRRFNQNSGREKLTRKFSTRGGAEPDREVYWLPQPGRWALFFPEYFKGTKRWGLWFGSQIKSERETHYPSLEINLDLDQSDISIAGRILVDHQNRFYLAHKGGLGGGHGSQMAIEDFAGYIKGHARQPVTLPDGREQLVYIIGGVDDANLLIKLRRYVLECERLRLIARRMNTNSHKKTKARSFKPDSFNPENSADGLGVGGRLEPRVIKRIHGRVVNALAGRLRVGANNKDPYGTKPDLFLRNKQGHMRLLFEVKISSDSQSMFTAIGQLLVYGANQPKPPKRVLVCPVRPDHPQICKILDEQNIHVVTYDFLKQGVTFKDLDPFLR